MDQTDKIFWGSFFAFLALIALAFLIDWDTTKCSEEGALKADTVVVDGWDYGSGKIMMCKGGKWTPVKVEDLRK